MLQIAVTVPESCCRVRYWLFLMLGDHSGVDLHLKFIGKIKVLMQHQTGQNDKMEQTESTFIFT